MIKINLLPASVFEKQIVRKLIMVFGMLLALIAAGGFGYQMMLSNVLAQKQTQLAQTQALEQQTLSTEKQATDEKAKIGPIRTKVDFIRNVMTYNAQAPQLYEELARFTYDKIRYKSIELNDSEMVIQAHAPSLADAGRYLLNLYRATHIFSQVSMDSVPQYSSTKEDAGDTGGTRLPGQGTAPTARRSTAFDFRVTCKLTKPLTSPSYGGAGAGATATGTAAAPAMGSGGTGSPAPSAPAGSPGAPVSNQPQIPLP